MAVAPEVSFVSWSKGRVKKDKEVWPKKIWPTKIKAPKNWVKKVWSKSGQ